MHPTLPKYEVLESHQKTFHDGKNPFEPHLIDDGKPEDATQTWSEEGDGSDEGG